jgi:PAS domain S-box-containing protein
MMPELHNGRSPAGEAAHLVALIESTQDLIWSVDLEFRILTFNRAFAENFLRNWGVAVRAGMTPAEILPPSRAQFWPPLFSRALRDGPFRTEYTLRDERWLEVTLNPIVEEGAAIGISCFGKDITERKLAEAFRGASEARFRTLVERAPTAIGISRSGTIVYVNPRYAEIFHLANARDAVGRPVSSQWDPSCCAAIDKLIRNRVPGSGTAIFDGIALRADGSLFPAHVESTPMPSPDGPADFAFITDLTETRTAEEALRASDARFRLLIEQAPTAIGIGRNGAAIYINRQYVEMFGLPSADYAVGRSFLEQWAPEWRSIIGERSRQRALGLPVPREYDAIAQRLDGSQFPAHLVAGLVDLPDGQASVGFITDITERNAAEQALRSSEARFRSFFELPLVGMLITSTEKGFLAVNDRACEILGYPRQELLQKTWAEITHPDDVAVNVECIERMLGGEIDRFSLEKRYIRKNGQVVWADISVGCVRKPDGAADYICTFMQDISLRKEAELNVGRLNRLFAMSSSINAMIVRETDVQAMFENACQIAVDVGKFRMAWIGVPDGDHRSLSPSASAGFVEGYLDGLRLDLINPSDSSGPTASAYSTGKPCICSDIATDAAFPARLSSAALQRRYRSLAAAPIAVEGHTVGVITLYATETGFFNAEEIGLIEGLASALGFAISTLRVAQARERSQRELRNSLEQTIAVIAETVSQRDPYTAGHERRVADLSIHIARILGLDEERVHGLRLAASIHDLGKIGVPAEILSKPGRLTPIQYALIREHAQLGYDIIKSVPFPWPIADVVREHHERLDGSGYPQGLTGDQIRLESRILAVADVVESMMTHRPYRPAGGIDSALEEIIKGSGSLYDSDAVNACVKLFREEGYRLPD